MPINIEDTFKAVSSVSDQVNRSFSSAIQEVGGISDGLMKSSSGSLGDTINNVSKLAKSLGGLGVSAAKSATTALSQLGTLGSYSKFNDTFKPPSKLKDITPDEAVSRRPKYRGGLSFPDDLGEYFIMFTFKAYNRKLPLTERTELPQLTINLPIPTNLQEQFSMQYSDKQLGIAGFIEENTKSLTGSAEDIGKKLGESTAASIEKITGSPAEAGLYGGRTLVGIADSIGSTVDVATGAVLNPFQSLVFQGINLRTHSFSFRFSPNSRRENQTLKTIISEFKKRMHPQKTSSSLFLNFPDVIDIKFGKEDGNPYFFKTCFLESMTVNYAPQGTPAFFAETGNPVEVELTLNFKEIKPITRNDFDEQTARESTARWEP